MSADEVRSAGEIFGKSSVLLLGADATEGAFKAEPLDSFRIIHIAAHGIGTMNFPDRAALVLGRDPMDQDDGLLQVPEIRELHLKADLVTLSACDTVHITIHASVGRAQPEIMSFRTTAIKVELEGNYERLASRRGFGIVWKRVPIRYPLSVLSVPKAALRLPAVSQNH